MGESEKGKQIVSLSLKQKREVFGAPLKPRRGNLISMFHGADNPNTSLDPNESAAILPAAVWELLCVLETDDRCLACPGIFRNSGGVEELQLLRARIEADDQIDWDGVDPNNIAGIFKMWLRELPEPLTTFEAYSIGVNAVGLEGEAKMSFVRRLIQRIPDANRIVLKKILLLLQLYASRSAENRMTQTNLAVVFAPALWREKRVTNDVRSVQAFVDLTSFMIAHGAELLP